MSDLERMKLSAALMIAPKHRELTPRSEKVTTPPAERVTWRQWWEKRFKDDYAKFVREHFESFKPKTEPTHDDTRQAQAKTQNQGDSAGSSAQGSDTRQGQQKEEI